jgi:hypothetical protein
MNMLATSLYQPRLSFITNIAPGGSDWSIHIRLNYKVINSMSEQFTAVCICYSKAYNGHI